MPQEPPPAKGSRPLTEPQTSVLPVVLIVEMNGDGHRLQYVSLLAHSAARKGCRVVLALAPDMPDALIEMHLPSALLVAKVVRADARTVDAIGILAEEISASTVIVPDGDRYALEIGRGKRWRSRARLKVVVMRWDAQADGNQLAVAAHIKVLAKRSLILRASRQSGVDVFVLRSSLWRGKLRLPVVVDPVLVSANDEGTAKIKSDWGLTGDRLWLGVLGAVSARKNVDVIAAAMKAVRNRRLGLLVAGMVDAETVARLEADRSDLRKVGHDVVIVDKLLTDAELDCAVAALDIAVLAHSNEGPSGLLMKAQALGTTVVAAGAKSLRRDLSAMRRESDRWCELSADAIALALTEVNPGQLRSFGTHTSVGAFVEPLVGMRLND